MLTKLKANSRQPGAFASFFMTQDPNALKLTAQDVPGLPALKTGKEFVVNSAGFINVELIQFEKRCNFWRKNAGKIPI